jgi:hypothetical protein
MGIRYAYVYPGARRQSLNEVDVLPLDEFLAELPGGESSVRPIAALGQPRIARTSPTDPFSFIFVELVNALDARYNSSGFPELSDADLAYRYPEAGRRFCFGLAANR